MKLNNMKSESFFALIAGALAGLTVGVLFAPEKGEETRRKVKTAASDGWDELTDAASESWDQTKEVYMEAKEDISQTGLEFKSRLLEQLERLEKVLRKDLDNE